jgi:hypothetical protein
VTEAVPALAMSEAGTVAVNWTLLTKLVAKARPFQFTVEPAMKPPPLTVRTNS